MSLHEISISDLQFNPFDKIGKEWYLVTSGDISHYNTMTASWGTLGEFWGKPVVNTFIRPQRYTFEFIEQNDLYTISFFSPEHKPALSYCGSHSGRDVDKAKETGLTPIALDGTTAFEEAELVFVCKKLYKYVLKPEEMIDKTIDKWYEAHDYHHCYFAEILKVYQK
jgi:flavin reductase (DIM6/NTAB) family NADH-FMN oxidoreductase RutF